MQQLSSITPLEIILLALAAVGVFYFFRACWRNIKRSRQHLGVALLTLMMSLTAQTAWAGNVMYVIATELSDNITITQENEDGNTFDFSVKKVKLTFYYGERPTSYAEGSEVWSQRTESFGGSCIFDVPTDVPTSNDYHYPAWYVNSSSKNAAKRHEAVTLISFDASFAAARPKSTAYWFYNMKNLTSNYIDFTNLNTSSTKSMKCMFYGCQRIKNLDLSGWNVSKVTNMSNMFSGCSNLNKIKLIGWEVTSLQYANSMFYDCEKLTYIYCDGNWDTSKLTSNNSLNMFSKCTSLPGYKSTTIVNKRKAKPQPDGYFTSTGLTWNASDGYYEINNEQDLIDLANYVNAGNECAGLTFKMTRDLDFTNMPKDLENGKGNFLPIGFGGKSFYGHFDGQNHSITDLYFNGASAYVGLFCIIRNSGIAVENVTLVNPNITASYPVGGIVASMNAGTISNCAIVGGSITAQYQVGGIVGEARNTTVSGCSVIGTSITAGNPVGIIAGLNKGGLTISNCNYYNIANGLSICGSGSYTDGGGNQQVYQVTLGEGITAASPAFAYGNKAYYAENATVTLGTNRVGYALNGFTSTPTQTISNGTFTMPTSDVSVSATSWTDMFGMAGGANGSEEHPYIISSTAGWNFFCDALQDNDTYNRFSGKTVKLAPSSGNSISVTRMAGSSQHDFTGTFDGDGKTLTVSYGTEAAPVSEEYAAPFRFVDGATIQNLHVEGSIISTVRRAAGVIGETGDNTSHITNCVSSSTISGGNFTGGFSIGGNVEIDGCVYNGKINGSGNSGGFVGYSQPTLKITNCLFAPQSGSSISGGTFYYNGGGNITPVNSYYTQKLGTAQGKQTYEVSAAPELLGEGTGEGIVKTYENYGLGFDKKYYLATIPLSETEGVIYLTDYLQGLEVPAEFKREFSAGKASTICLPFAMDNVSGGKVYSFAGITYDEKDGWVATMSETGGNNVTKTEANTPYVFMPDADGEVTFSGTTDKIPAAYDAEKLSTTSGDWTFQGTYEVLKYGTNLDGPVYGFASTDKVVDGVKVSAGEFVKAKEGAGVKPMRCYLIYGNASAGTRAADDLPQSITVRFLSSTGGTTTIGTLDTETGEIDFGGWYTLSGRKLDTKPTQKGLYIHNGKKIVIK